MVRGSVQREPDGVTIRFVVGDGDARTPVSSRGIVPDLFREGSGVVAEGRMQSGTFVADTILAKHDSATCRRSRQQAAEHAVGKTVQR